MSQSRKKHKRKQPKREIQPFIPLRSRLDKLLSTESLIERDGQAIKADLDAMTKGLKAYEFFPVLLKAYQSAPAPVQTRLDELVPEWLGESGGVETLLKLLKEHVIDHEGQEYARTWLEAAGADLSVLQELQAETPFYRAFTYTDRSQGVIIVLWYTDSRRHKVRGMNFLLDFNPPWEGALKEIAVLPSCSPQQAIQEYVETWTQMGMPPESLGAAEAKREILKSLEANRREGIRLPRDLILSRQEFIENILSLPDMPDTPSFTAEDLEKLRYSGKTPESISLFEQTVGRRVRLEDGKEVMLLGHPSDEDDW